MLMDYRIECNPARTAGFTLVAGPFRACDLVVHVVLAGRLLHRQTLHFRERPGVVNHQRAIHFPAAHERVFAVARDLVMRRGLAGRGREGLDDFKRALIDDLDGVFRLAHHRVGPGVWRVLVRAQEEPRAEGLDALDGFPFFHVNDADRAFLEVGRGQYRFALILPGNAGTQVRQAGQLDVGDLAPDVEVHHLAVFALACRADEVLVRLIEE